MSFVLHTLDSHVFVDGEIVGCVDHEWATDTLPYEDICVPLHELPDPEPDSATANLSLRQLEAKWSDLVLSNLTKSPLLVPHNQPISNPNLHIPSVFSVLPSLPR